MRIEQTIYVERESQRKIVLGKGGQTIKAIGEAARSEIADVVEQPRCTCSCSSRCARAGATTPSATGRWGWSFPRSEFGHSGTLAISERTRNAESDAEIASEFRVRGLAPAPGMTLKGAMQWTDEGIVLGVKRHGEASAILELMTRAHGRHLGLVRGGVGSRLKPVLQPGNTVSATWRARLDEHLGNYVVEGLDLRAGEFLRRAARGLWRHASRRAVPVVARARSASATCTPRSTASSTARRCAAAPRRMVVRFELQLLAELGFGLDLSQCAATGATADLIYVSPKSGAGGIARRRRALAPTSCCGCRPFFASQDALPAGGDVVDGFALTGFFLTRHVLEPRGLALADERGYFIAALTRELPSVA